LQVQIILLNFKQEKQTEQLLLLEIREYKHNLNLRFMRNKKIVFIAILLLFIGLKSLHAQETIAASGSNATGGGGSISYSVGQIVYTYITGTNGSSLQGVQQPYEISLVTTIEEAKDISLEIEVYPNPATDLIMLKIKNTEAEDFKYQLHDINGSLLNISVIESQETNISMQNLVPGIYFLKVIQGNKEIKTYKIIKK
jgi:hypothetical protein